jgi:16S rRNA (cytosine967-C5)-methyltransferase
VSARRGRGRGSARAIAHEILVRVETTDAFADVLLTHRLSSADLPTADRALATELVYGTLTWQGRLDHHLKALVHEPLERLDPPVRAALRLGLFQLLCLDRVPAYAAVDESVRLAGRAGGLANAVLRRAARAGRGGLPLPDAAADPIERLAVEWSHPRWLVERWAGELGMSETAALLEADSRAPRVAIRPSVRRTTPDDLRARLAADGVGTEPGRLHPGALVVTEGAARLRSSPGYRDGLFSFQGEASQLVSALVDVAPDATVLDACAGSGGKALAVAERLGSSGGVVALDPGRAGLRQLAAEASRLGISNVARVAGDARRPPLRHRFDAVLVDAPCSGLGTLRRHPELKWRRHPDDVPRLARLQREILDGVVDLVRPGGALVYAVCTRTRDETTAIVGALVATHPRFAVERPALAAVAEDGFVYTAPHTHGVDGFFAARLRATR